MSHLNAGILAIKTSLPSGPRFAVREANIPLRGLHGAKKALQWLAYKRMYNHASAIVCPARQVADGVVRLVPRASDRVIVIHNPVDVAAIRARAISPIRWEGKGLRYVAVGRLTYQKGFDRLIDCLAELPPTSCLTIIGDGPDEARLQSSIRERGFQDRVALKGFLDNPMPYIAGADALLLPSRWEGLPNIALEALACGTPVVATPEAGGIDEIVAAAPNAVSLAHFGREFDEVATQVRPKPTPKYLSASLLPKMFERDSVIIQYEALFDSLVG